MGTMRPGSPWWNVLEAMNRGYGQVRLIGAVSSTVLIATVIGLALIARGFPDGVATFIWMIVFTLAGLTAIGWLIGLVLAFWARTRRV